MAVLRKPATATGQMRNSTSGGSSAGSGSSKSPVEVAPLKNSLQREAVVNVHKADLKKRGYSDLEHWVKDASHVYIGRNLEFYVKGAVKSKWSNPYPVKKHGLTKCLALYKKRIVTGIDEKGRPNSLRADLGGLIGKELGCWCHPSACHGDVLVELLKELKPTPINACK